MHTKRFRQQERQESFLDPKGEEKLSKLGWSFVDKVLTMGMNSVFCSTPVLTPIRRLDPHFEAPNQLKASPVIADP